MSPIIPRKSFSIIIITKGNNFYEVNSVQRFRKHNLIDRDCGGEVGFMAMPITSAITTIRILDVRTSRIHIGKSVPLAILYLCSFAHKTSLEVF